MPVGPDNPHGNGFKAVERDLLTEQTAMRIADPFKGRIWKIKNPHSLHPVTGSAPAHWKDQTLHPIEAFPDLAQDQRETALQCFKRACALRIEYAKYIVIHMLQIWQTRSTPEKTSLAKSE